MELKNKRFTEEELLKEIKSRFGEDWENARIKAHADGKHYGTENSGVFLPTGLYAVDGNTDEIWNKNGIIYCEGLWAEPLKEQQLVTADKEEQDDSNSNKVAFIGYYGSDEAIALSAWTSTSRALNEDKRNRIPQLIEKLWSEGHETPFEKGVVHFLVDTDIATHIHLLKHRISSANAESGRYKELKEDKMYIPKDWPQDLQDTLKDFSDFSNELYHKVLKELEPVLGRKRAKESARYFKTYNSRIQTDISFNLRSFYNFIKLRNSEHAQVEIREVAAEMLRLVKENTNGAFKHTLESMEKYEDIRKLKD